MIELDHNEDALPLDRDLSLLHIALRLGRLGAWRLTLPEMKLIWSAQVREIHEVDEDFIPTLDIALSFFPPEWSGTVLEAFNKCIHEGRPFDLELQIVTAQGDRRWVRAIAEAIVDAQGKISCVQGAFQDISESKQTEQRVQESARRLANSLETIAEGLFTLDREWRFTYLNGEAERLLKITRSELMGKNIWDVFSDSEAQKFKVEYERAIRENSPVTFRNYYPPYDRWIEIRAYPSAESLAVYFKDVTKEHVAEHRIAEQAALLDNAQDAILVTDFSGSIIYWNRGAERVFGFTRDEALGEKSVELLKAERARHNEAYSELMNSGEWTGELKKHAKGDRELFLHTRLTLMRDEIGQPKSVLAINTDITEKKKLEAQFLRAQRMESIGTLAGGIAHDLNNVLAPIMMCLDMLELQVTGEEDRKLIATAQKSTQRGAELVRQVLSFARGLEGKRVAFKPTHILREVHKIARDTFPKNIKVSHSAGAELLCAVGDPTQLHQVLMNLCVNARDAMPNGGALHISAENMELDEVYSGLNTDARPGRYVVINVADTGVGIAPEIREKIFDPFFTTKDMSHGTGLGLSTTLGIVKSHGGFIKVMSGLGQGTTFSVFLPATASEGEESAARTLPVKLPQGNGETILVVDDEESVRIVASKTLERNGYKVLLASNGAEAVSIYATQRHEIAAVLTDMAMPILDGAATVVALKCINRTLPVIGSSGLANVSALTKSLGSDLNGFIAKPYSAEALLSTLQGVLAKDNAALSDAA